MTVENLEIKVKTNAGTAAKQFDSLSNALDKVSTSAKSVHGKLSIGLKNVSDSAKKATKSTNDFVSSLMRIAKYRIFRSVIKAVTDAFSEGLKNAYAFSDAIVTEGHRFASALDSMSSAGLKMKNQLGSALIALLAAVEPILTAIINLITKVADAMSQLFAVFTGGTYLKAIDAPKKWADAAGGAAKKAKEWKNQLLGFDEINRLEEPSNNNGGGGSDVLDPTMMFEDTPISGIFAKIKAKVDELKESLDFEPLRQSWERLRESASNLANTIIKVLGWAWDNILVPFSHWTIEKLAPELVKMLANAFDVLNGIIKSLSPAFNWLWQNVLQPCFAFIGDVAIKILETFNGLLEKLAKLLNGEVSFKEFIQGLTDSETVLGTVLMALGVNGLIGLLTKLSNSVLVGVFLGVGKLGTALSALVSNPVALAIIAIGALILIGVELYKHWDELVEKFQEFRQTLVDALNDGKLTWLDFVAVVVESIINVIEGIATLIQWIQNLVAWIKNALEGFDILINKSNIAKKADARAAEIESDGSIYLTGFASGGFPAEGQLFLSRESGPELVGTMGGHTAVANNDQIVEGIRQGVYDAVVAANGSGNHDVSVKVYLDSKEIRYGQQRLARASGV